MGKGQIAGVLQGLGCLLRPMARRTPAVQQLGTAGDLLGPLAIKGGIQVNGPAIQGRRHGQHLKSGSRLIAIGQHPIPPLLQPRLGQGYIISLLSGGVFRASLGAAFIGSPHVFQVLTGFLVPHQLVVIGVVASQGCHGQDLAGLAVHDQAKCAVLHIIAVYRCPELLFQDLLHRGIQRQNHAAPGMGGCKAFIGKGHIHFVIALGCDHLSGFPGEEAVIGRFHALAALAG